MQFIRPEMLSDSRSQQSIPNKVPNIKKMEELHRVGWNKSRIAMDGVLLDGISVTSSPRSKRFLLMLQFV